MRVPSAPSRVVGLAKVPQRAYLDLSGATAWDISPVGSRGNLDFMQYALIFFDVQLILAQMPPGVPDLRCGGRCPLRGARTRELAASVAGGPAQRVWGSAPACTPQEISLAYRGERRPGKHGTRALPHGHSALFADDKHPRTPICRHISGSTLSTRLHPFSHAGPSRSGCRVGMG